MIKKTFEIKIIKENKDYTQKFCVVENSKGIIAGHSYHKSFGWTSYTGWKYDIEIPVEKRELFKKVEQITEDPEFDKKIFEMTDCGEYTYKEDGYTIVISVIKICETNKSHINNTTTNKPKPTTYVGNGFSPSMINGSARIQIDTINEKEFLNNIKNAKSIIGHPEIAKEYGVPLNREQIRLNKGDILYVVTPTNRPAEGKVVANGVKYEYIPKSMGHTYTKIEVIL